MLRRTYRNLSFYATVFLCTLCLSSSLVHASSWLMSGYDAQSTYFNPQERILRPNSVPRLHRAWSIAGVYSAVATDRAVYALALDSGQVPAYALLSIDSLRGRLHYRVAAASLGLDSGQQPLAIAYARGHVVIATLSVVVGLVASTGRVAWRSPGGATALTISGTTIFTAKTCHVACGANASYAIDVRTGRTLWSHAGAFSHLPVMLAGRLFQTWGEECIGNTRVYDPGTGQLVATLPLYASWTGTNSATYAASLYPEPPLGNRKATLLRLDASGRPEWRVNLGSECSATPAPAYGLIYTQSNRFHRGIIAVDSLTGKVRWGADIGAHLQLAVANHLLFVLHSTTGQLTVLRADNGHLVRELSVAGSARKSSFEIIAGGTLYVSDGSRLSAFRT